MGEEKRQKVAMTEGGEETDVGEEKRWKVAMTEGGEETDVGEEKRQMGDDKRQKWEKRQMGR